MTVDPSGRASPVIGETSLGPATTRERSKVAALAAVILAVVGGYLLLRSTSGDAGGLLPFQMLARDLASADRAMFETLKTRILELEALRARSGRWPEPEAAAGLPRSAPGGESGRPRYVWQRAEEGIIANYLARPGADDSSAAWLVVYREPDPSAPADTAPNDEEHHRLPDGTVLHVSIWTRRFGGQVGGEFVRQPEAAGWTQILTAPLDRRAPLFGPLPPSR